MMHEKSYDRNDWIQRYALALVARGFTFPNAVGIAESNWSEDREDDNPENEAAHYDGKPFPFHTAVTMFQAIEKKIDELFPELEDGQLEELKYNHEKDTFYAYFYMDDEYYESTDRHGGYPRVEEFLRHFMYVDGQLTVIDQDAYWAMTFVPTGVTEFTDHITDIIQEMMKGNTTWRAK